MKTWLAALSLMLIPAGANASASVIINGIDVSAAVEYFRPMVTPLKKSVTVYNWSTNTLEFGQTSDYNETKVHSHRFWKMYGSASSDMYGTGLYAAVDPVFTFGYGGPDWRVQIMTLPVGFKLLDLARLSQDYGNQATPPAVVAILSQFGCPVSANPEPLFNAGGASLSSTCQNLVRIIFSKTLEIDGFAYFYGQTNMPECQQGMASGSRAFVITNDEWVTPTNVHFLNKASKGNLDERILIQTLFLKASEQYQFVGTAADLDVIEGYLNAHADRDLVSSKTVCQGATCVITVHFCDGKKTCEDVDLPPLPRPGGPLIKAGESGQSLLWSDLDGQPKSTTISTYLRNTQFGCDGNLPYDSGL